MSNIYITEDTNTFFSIKASNLVGLPLITEEQRQATLSRLRHLYEEYNSVFDEAIDLTIKNKDPLMMAGVLLLIGNAAGQRCLAYRNMDVLDRAEYEKLLCKKSLLTAKNLYSSINEEAGVVNAVHNLANQLRFFDEKDEALALAKQSIESAKRINNTLLLQKAIRLEENIRTGIIPDYINGERNKPYV